MQLEDGVKFCPGCGATIEATPQGQAPQQPQYAPPPPQYGTAPPPAPQQGQAPPPQYAAAPPPPPQQQYAPPQEAQQQYAPPQAPQQQYAPPQEPQQQYAPPQDYTQQQYAPPQEQAPPQYAQQQYAQQQPQQPPYQQPAQGQYPGGPPQAPAYGGAYAASAPKKKLPKWMFIAIAAAAAVVVVILVLNQTGGTVNVNQDYFTIGADQVPSVKLVLGEERKISGSSSTVEKGVTTVVVKYSVGENQNAEMKKYADALVNDYKFTSTAPYDFSGSSGKGIEFAKESKEDGYVVLVTIDYGSSGYDLTIKRGKGKLTIHDSGNTSEDDNPKPPEEPDDPPEVIEDPPPPDDEEDDYVPPTGNMNELHIPLPFVKYYTKFLKSDALVVYAEEGGFSYVVNADGSYTYTLTTEQQNALIANHKDIFYDYMVTLVSDNRFPGLTDIDWDNDGYSWVQFTAEDKFFDAENKWFQCVIIAGYSAPMGQVYMGKGDNAKTSITIVDTNGVSRGDPLICPDAIIDAFDGG